MRTSRISDLVGGWPRRVLALTCLLLALLSAIHSRDAATKSSTATVAVLVASRSLAVGMTLSAGNVRIAQWPASVRPATALQRPLDAIGRRLASPLTTGDAVTQQRLVGGDLAAGLPAGTVAAPITLANSAAANLIRAGDYVDLLSPPSPDGAGTSAQILALGVLVLAVLPESADSAQPGAQLVVALERASELKLAQAESEPVLATVSDHP
jgi:Flp pilus assembly protein CpaB